MRKSAGWRRFLLCLGDCVHLNRFRLGVQRARDHYLFSGELLGVLLIAQVVGVLAVKEDIGGAMCVHTGDRALRVVGSHTHS